MVTDVKPVQKQALLDHEKLTVYQIAIEFVILADEVIEHLPRGRAYLGDQLQRAALSIYAMCDFFSVRDRARDRARARPEISEHPYRFGLS